MNNLRKLRKEAGIPLRELERMTHITHSVLTFLEKGTRPFRQVHLDALTSFFNVTNDYLMGKSDLGYIVRPQYGDEELLLSEKEYIRLRDNIEISIIENKCSFTAKLDTKVEEQTITLPHYSVYRELKGSTDDYDMKETLSLKLDGLKKKMTEDDLRKTIKFIEEYILK